MPEGPVTTRRRLRSELKRLREETGLPQAEVVKQLDWSLSKLIRIENGTVGVSVTDVRALLGVYRADSVVEDLVSLARSARERRWWSRYRDILSPQYQEFIGFEAEAARLRQFHPTLVPGLLQIEPYVRTVMAALLLRPLPQSHYEGLIEVRMRRQREILQGENPAGFTVVIDEAAVRRLIGGVEVMRAQIEHLVQMQASDRVSIAVLPFSAGAHVGLMGAFHLMEFADEADDNVLYVETAHAGVVLRDQPDVLAAYSTLFERMLEMSLQGAQAAELLRKIATQLA